MAEELAHTTPRVCSKPASQTGGPKINMIRAMGIIGVTEYPSRAMWIMSEEW